ncbi:MAG: hypothetical protein JOZ52_08745 [Acidobacteria bacterium]|nr:hypothetical protein [Acidobacteriota bacterium]
MSNDTTQNMNGANSFEEREMWEDVLEQLKQLNQKLDIVISDIYDLRANNKSLDRRITNIEDTRSQ